MLAFLQNNQTHCLCHICHKPDVFLKSDHTDYDILAAMIIRTSTKQIKFEEKSPLAAENIRILFTEF